MKKRDNLIAKIIWILLFIGLSAYDPGLFVALVGLQVMFYLIDMRTK